MIATLNTVEPRYPALDYPEPRLSGLAVFFLIRLHNSENGRVPQMRMRVAAVTMETCLLFFCACADNMRHCCSSIKWVDQGVVYLFDYPAYSLIRLASIPGRSVSN